MKKVNEKFTEKITNIERMLSRLSAGAGSHLRDSQYHQQRGNPYDMIESFSGFKGGVDFGSTPPRFSSIKRNNEALMKDLERLKNEDQSLIVINNHQGDSRKSQRLLTPERSEKDGDLQSRKSISRQKKKRKRSSKRRSRKHLRNDSKIPKNLKKRGKDRQGTAYFEGSERGSHQPESFHQVSNQGLGHDDQFLLSNLEERQRPSDYESKSNHNQNTIQILDEEAARAHRNLTTFDQIYQKAVSKARVKTQQQEEQDNEDDLEGHHLLQRDFTKRRGYEDHRQVKQTLFQNPKVLELALQQQSSEDSQNPSQAHHGHGLYRERVTIPDTMILPDVDQTIIERDTELDEDDDDDHGSNFNSKDRNAGGRGRRLESILVQHQTENGPVEFFEGTDKPSSIAYRTKEDFVSDINLQGILITFV